MSSEKPQVRKIITVVEETHGDGTVRLDTPTRKSAAAAVFTNPFAGKYQEDLSLLIQWSEELGELLTKKAVAALGLAPDKVHSYGKGAIVGTNGELEHCAAIMHPAQRLPPGQYTYPDGRHLKWSGPEKNLFHRHLHLPCGHRVQF